MYRIIQGTSQNLPDVSAFIKTLENSGEFFGNETEIFVTRAPGRLDVMGGIADYSGSLVLEMPIAEAVFTALQKDAGRFLKIISVGGSGGQNLEFEMPLEDFVSSGRLIEYEQARAYFKRDLSDHWAAYAAGAFLVLMRERGADFTGGARILVSSQIPEGKGVSSSAAFEVAVMSAAAAAFDLTLPAREIAILCQKVENLIVGAPCGIMDQMSVACGRENQLMSMICQPAEVQKAVSIPDEIAFWGIDSGIRHSVGGGDYGSVRTGAFIGYRIIADLAGCRVEETEIEGFVKIEDEKWNGYLANLKPEEFEDKYAAHLPREISGAEFLVKYKGITDSVTKILPDKIYAVFNPTAHPIYENARVRCFAELLNGQITESRLKELGELMFQSHTGYSACGLGTDGTDLLVKMVKENNNGLYGAKITGGGSGGTVAVLGRSEAAAEIGKIAELYERGTGHRPHIFSGSSPGAAAFDFLKLRRV